MGKKRRYIQRVKKFSKKAFNFLDKLDGTADSDLTSSKIDTHISRIVVTDRGNQTISFVARCHGPGDTTTGNLQGDKVIYTIDGTAVHGDGVITMNVAGSGRDKNTASSAAPAIVGSANTDFLLSVGGHTISAAIYSEDEGTKLSEDFEVDFSVDRSEITLSDLASAFTADDANGQVDLDLSQITVAGKRPGEEAAYDPTNTGKDSFTISCVDSAGDAVTLDAAKTTLAEGAARTDADTDILDTAVTSGQTETFTFTFTPRTAADADLTADAVSVDVTVTRP